MNLFKIRDPKFPHTDDRRSARGGSAAVVADSESSESEDEEEDEEAHGRFTFYHLRLY
jgi:hypothetical protein